MTRDLPLYSAEELEHHPRPASPEFPPSKQHEIQQNRVAEAINEGKKPSLETVGRNVTTELGGMAERIFSILSSTAVSVGALTMMNTLGIGRGQQLITGRPALASNLASGVEASVTKMVDSIVHHKPSALEAALSAYQIHIKITEEALDRPDRPDDVKLSIRLLDKKLQTLKSRGKTLFGQLLEPEQILKYLDARAFLFSLPYREHRTLGILADDSPEQQAALDEQIEKFAGTYPESMRKDLKEHVRSMAEGGDVQPTLLHGPGGTGKTHLARSVADLLGLPLVDISAKDGLASLYPISTGFDNYHDNDANDTPPSVEGSRVGKLANRIQHVGYKNFILFCDEVDFASDARLIKGWIQNGKMAPLKLPSLGIEVPIDAILILATNDEPNDPALVGRMRVFHMDTVSPQTKVNVAVKSAREVAQKRIDRGLLSEDHANQAFELTHGAILEIVAQDKSPGVRESQNVASQLFMSIASGVRRNSIPAEDEIRARVEELVAEAERARLRSLAAKKPARVPYGGWGIAGYDLD
jgi:MoxR-like ATPase